MRLMKIVFASSNKGKLKEAKSLLGSFGVELVSQSELGILPCDEPHITFVENSFCLLYTSPSPRDRQKSRMPSSA